MDARWQGNIFLDWAMEFKLFQRSKQKHNDLRKRRFPRLEQNIQSALKCHRSALAYVVMHACARVASENHTERSQHPTWISCRDKMRSIINEKAGKTEISSSLCYRLNSFIVLF